MGDIHKTLLGNYGFYGTRHMVTHILHNYLKNLCWYLLYLPFILVEV